MKPLPPPPELRPDYVQEGQFFAWPLAVSGECEPIPPDSAQVCAVAPTADGRVVWGATDGEECHVFAALFKGAAGGIVDLGVIPEAFTIQAVVPIPAGHPLAVGAYSALALAWIGPGWELWRCQSPGPHDSVQEPGYGHAAPECLAKGDDHEACGLALLGDRPVVWTDRAIWAVESDGSTTKLLELAYRPVCTPVSLDDAHWWLNEKGKLAGLTADGAASPVKIAIPLKSGVADLCTWGNTLLAFADGVLYDLAPSTNVATPLAQAPLPDVQCIAGLPDGRAYGVCGHGIGHVFRVDRDPARCVALGAAATAVGHHRYGFEFAAAATSAEGVIFLAEHDRAGHLWTFYPPLT